MDITVHVAHIWGVMQPGTEDQALCDDCFGDTFKAFGLVFRERGGYRRKSPARLCTADVSSMDHLEKICFD